MYINHLFARLLGPSHVNQGRPLSYKRLGALQAYAVVGLVLAAGASARAESPLKPPRASSELLERLSTRFKDRSSVQGEFAFGLYPLSQDGEVRGEFHASSMPVMTPLRFTQTAILPRMSNHPIGNSLIELIDNTPEGAVIRVAVYIFDNQEVQDALVRAIHRGVTVQLLTTDKGAKVAQVLSNALRSRQGAQDSSDEVVISPQDRPQQSSIQLCKNKSMNSSGGCLGVNLLHHKFATFSRVCRFGLVGTRCAESPKLSQSKVYRWLVFQSSWNFKGITKHEMASAFLGNRDLYRTYRRNFFLMNQQVPTTNLDSTTVDVMGSNLKVQFTPFWRNAVTKETYRATDIFLRELSDLRCMHRGKASVVRIANTHWNKPVSDEVVSRVKELVTRGCRVEVLLPADMAPEAARYSDEKRISVSKEDATIFNDLVATGADVRTFAKAPNVANYFLLKDGEALPHMHSKYVIVEDARGPSHSKLMFGTLSFTWASQEFNDEVWLVWQDPSRTAMKFYNNAFGSQFSRLARE